MDDYLYFLLLIAWLAFSFYQQSAKKKKRLEQVKEAQENERRRQEEMQSDNQSYVPPIQNSEPQTPPSIPDFKKTLEDILMGGGLSLEDIPEEEAQSLEVIPETQYEKKAPVSEENIYQKYYDKEIAGKQYFSEEEIKSEIEEGIGAMDLGSLDEVHDEVPEEARRHFDLRNAVIYSEILNRRYAN